MKRVHCLFSIALLSVLFPAHALSQGYEPILQEGKQWYLKSLYGYYKDWQFFVNGDTIVDGVPGHQFCWTMVADEQTDSDGNARKRLTVRETVRHPASGIATTHDCDGRGRWPFI